MSCDQCIGIEKLFDEKSARKEMKKYLKSGPGAVTQRLIDNISLQVPEGTQLLDIGGGIGAIPFEMLKKGVDQAVSVDASSGYQVVVKEEVEQRQLQDRFHFRHGDFTEISDQIESADVVTMDKVICCYPDMEGLLSQALRKSKKIFGVVHPRSNWWIQVFRQFGTFFFWISKNPFRFYPHKVSKVESLIESYGFTKTFSHRGYFWITSIYEKNPSHG